MWQSFLVHKMFAKNVSIYVKPRPGWSHSTLHVSSDAMHQRICVAFEITGRLCTHSHGLTLTATQQASWEGILVIECCVDIDIDIVLRAWLLYRMFLQLTYSFRPIVVYIVNHCVLSVLFWRHDLILGTWYNVQWSELTDTPLCRNAIYCKRNISTEGAQPSIYGRWPTIASAINRPHLLYP